MAQTFGMGRYVPPDLEGTMSHNQASGKGHALGARARKLKSEGFLIVRFECPFAIWCTHCEPETIIGQGVRFNAEKKKVGQYYSTPVWSFRFKHSVCGGSLEVRTDPKNAEYVVVEGGRRRDTGDMRRAKDSLVEDYSIRVALDGLGEEEKERLEKDGGFAALEKKVTDKKEADSQTKRIEQLVRESDKHWADPYETSRQLRKEFRVGRRQRQADEKSGNLLRDKYGIDLDLLAPTQEDEERSKLVNFGDPQIADVSSSGMFDKHKNKGKPTLGTSSMLQIKGHESKSQKEAETAARKVSLQNSLQGNTRNIADPFLRDNNSWAPRVKRKRSENDRPEQDVQAEITIPASTSSAALVAYDSDESV